MGHISKHNLNKIWINVDNITLCILKSGLILMKHIPKSQPGLDCSEYSTKIHTKLHVKQSSVLCEVTLQQVFCQISSFFLKGYLITSKIKLKVGRTKTKTCSDNCHRYQQQRDASDVFVSTWRSKKSSCAVDNLFSVDIGSDPVTRHQTSSLPRYSKVNRSWRHWMQTAN